MNPTLTTAYQQLETERQALFAMLQQYPAEVLNRQPRPGAWSVNQVIGHLMAAEGASLKYLQKKTQNTAGVPKPGIKGLWRMFLIRAFFVLPLKIKAPEIVNPPETTPGSLAETDKQWQAIRVGIHSLLQGLKEEDYEKEIWKHALAGKLNIYHMYAFFGMHFNRHRAQIERTLKQVQ